MAPLGNLGTDHDHDTQHMARKVVYRPPRDPSGRFETSRRQWPRRAISKPIKITAHNIWRGRPSTDLFETPRVVPKPHTDKGPVGRSRWIGLSSNGYICKEIQLHLIRLKTVVKSQSLKLQDFPFRKIIFSSLFKKRKVSILQFSHTLIQASSNFILFYFYKNDTNS